MSELYIIPNISDYTINFNNGNLIARKKNKDLEKEFLNHDFKGSKIIKCIILDDEKEIKLDKLKYNNIIRKLWTYIGDINKIQEITTYNKPIHNGNKEENNIQYIKELHISFQYFDVNDAVKEILHIIKQKKYTIDLEIELSDNDIIYFKSKTKFLNIREYIMPFFSFNNNTSY
jgi:hypothetical protein